MWASSIGSTLEWYDFVTFAFLATYISQNFFPSGNETAALLATFATFGVGFLARPLGGLLFGALGDRRGRKNALMTTMVLMAGATVMIGILPGFGSIGYAAPVLLVTARFLQGLSAGGEGPTAMIYAVEWAPPGKRGLYAGYQMTGSGAGLLLGSVSVTLLVTFLTKDQVTAWGWRLPFLFGILIGPLGVWIRRAVDESPAYVLATHRTVPIPGDGRAVPWKGIATIVLLDMPWAIAYYVFLSYMPTFSQKYLGVSPKAAFMTNTLTLIVYLMAMPVFGWLSDRVGRKPVLLFANLAFAVLSYPLFLLLTGGVGLVAYCAILLLFTVLLSMYSGPAVALFAEQFPPTVRGLWFSLSYGIAVALFGGFTPFVSTWLIEKFSNPLAPTFYITATAAVGALVVLLLRETAFDGEERWRSPRSANEGPAAAPQGVPSAGTHAGLRSAGHAID